MLVLRTTLGLGRRILIPSTITMGSPNNSLSKLKSAENSTKFGGGSERLWVLSQQLRLYKPPPNSIFDQIEEQQKRQEEEEEDAVVGGGVVGFAEAATPERERFRFKKAAVLVCLYEEEGDGRDELRVILTRRSSTLSTHSGEISLPGGKAEEGENDADTATREAKEEIGLDPSLVNVVTALEPFLSKHLLRVTPVIGILSSKNEFNPTPNAGEVDEVFDAPLEMFIKDENRRCEEREWMGYKYLIHYFDFETESKKYLIWGLTAGILIRAASVVYQKPPAFQEQYPEFKFPTFVNKDSVLP